MATYSQTRHGYTLRLTITETATNVETNKSTITYSLQLISGNQYHFEQFGVGAAITFDGTTIASRSRANDPQLSIGFNSTLTLLSGSKTVTHNNDGTKTIALGYSLDMADYYYTPGPISGSGSFVCATIPRATTPTLSASSINLGESVTISVANRASSSFSHKFTYTLGSLSGDIGTLNANASPQTIAWLTADNFAKQIKTSLSAVCTISCETLSGTTSIGIKTVNLTLKVPNTATFQPSASISAISEQDATVASLFPNGDYLVQGKSKINVTASGTGKYSATIAGLTTKVNNVAYEPPQNIPITASGTITISATATDSRGLSGTASTTKTSLAYSAPKASGVQF